MKTLTSCAACVFRGKLHSECHEHDGEVLTALLVEGTMGMEKVVVIERTVPAPPAGRYYEGTRIMPFLESAAGSRMYSPLGSGYHDAYPGVFQITPGGVNPERYRFAGDVLEHAASEKRFVDFIISLPGDQ